MESILAACRSWLRYHAGRLASDMWVPQNGRRIRFESRERRIDEALAVADRAASGCENSL